MVLPTRRKTQHLVPHSPELLFPFPKQGEAKWQDSHPAAYWPGKDL